MIIGLDSGKVPRVKYKIYFKCSGRVPALEQS